MTNITSDDFNRLYEQYKKICGNPIPTREDKEKRLEFIQKLNKCAQELTVKTRYTPALNWLCKQDLCVRKKCACKGHKKPVLFEDIMFDHSQKTNAGSETNTDDARICESTIPSKEDVKEALKALDHLIGLDNVKLQIEIMVKDIIVRMKREKLGLNTEPASRHMVLLGNPGTGKTEIARLIAHIFHTLGFCNSDTFVETDRAGLVGTKIGHSEEKTSKLIQKARGGVLFIDEAYALIQYEGYWDYGHDVVSTLIKAMEDYREDLIIIAAGYSDQMKRFLKSNPGLESRFSHTINFPDYSQDELVDIFQRFCDRQEYVLCDRSKNILYKGLLTMPFELKNNFGNARGVRNLFEKTISNQSLRVYNNDLDTEKCLREILPQDIPFDITPNDGNVYFLKT